MALYKSTYFPRERELRIEFTRNIVFFHEDVSKNDIDELEKEAVQNFKEMTANKV